MISSCRVYAEPLSVWRVKNKNENGNKTILFLKNVFFFAEPNVDQ